MGKGKISLIEDHCHGWEFRLIRGDDEKGLGGVDERKWVVKAGQEIGRGQGRGKWEGIGKVRTMKM